MKEKMWDVQKAERSLQRKLKKKPKPLISPFCHPTNKSRSYTQEYYYNKATGKNKGKKQQHTKICK